MDIEFQHTVFYCVGVLLTVNTLQGPLEASASFHSAVYPLCSHYTEGQYKCSGLARGSL